jgi:hypothetical protein
MSALYTGRDISGQPVERVTVEDVAGWEAEGDLGSLGCESGCLVLSRIAGPDGWPLATKGGGR